jgi:hypothetical protein
MKEVKILKAALREHLPMNAARFHCLISIIIAILKVRTVNLVEIADGLPGKSKKESKYKRIQRLFQSFSFDYTMIAQFVVKLLGIKDLSWVLSIDRTNWKFGKLNINILTVGIAYLGAAFPIVWILLPKRGNSNTRERIKIIDRFINIFGVDKIKCITGDREFIGTEWFAYLLEKHIPFRLRIKDNTLVTNSQGIPAHAKTLFRFLKPKEYHVLKGKRSVLGHQLFVIGLKQTNGEYVILATPKEPEQAMEDYEKRWEIETLFGCLKTRGFNFESTHMTNPDRIMKLVAILAITFSWCHITGEWLHTQKPIKIKKHGRRAISIFRYGLDMLRGILLNLTERLSNFKQMVNILVKSIDSSSLESEPMNQNKKFLSCT